MTNIRSVNTTMLTPEDDTPEAELKACNQQLDDAVRQLREAGASESQIILTDGMQRQFHADVMKYNQSNDTVHTFIRAVGISLAAILNDAVMGFVKNREEYEQLSSICTMAFVEARLVQSTHTKAELPERTPEEDTGCDCPVCTARRVAEAEGQPTH